MGDRPTADEGAPTTAEAAESKFAAPADQRRVLLGNVEPVHDHVTVLGRADEQAPAGGGGGWRLSIEGDPDGRTGESPADPQLAPG